VRKEAGRKFRIADAEGVMGERTVAWVVNGQRQSESQSLVEGSGGSVRSQKTPFFIVTAVKTSNLTTKGTVKHAI
jgi:hypothetical protein